MNQKEAKELGRDRGYNCASWVDIPDIGTVVKPFELSGFSGTVETADDQRECFECMAYDSEEHGRCYTPFEFIAAKFNDAGDRSEGLWEAFDEGITLGIGQFWRERETSERLNG